ncbi:MAG: PAS domain-containing sensor histidine kinase [Promethearchaeota archaeon]
MSKPKIGSNMLKADYKSVFNKIPTPTYLWKKQDKELILIDYNNAANEITEGKIKSYIGIKASELYKEYPQILEEMNRCINEQKYSSKEIAYHYQSTGKDKILVVIYDFISPDLLLIQTEDITKQKIAEEKLRESEVHFRSIVENSHDGIFIVNDKYKIIYVNSVLSEMLDFSYEEIIGQDFRKFLDEESVILVSDRYIRRQRGGENVPPRYEFNIVRKNGEKRRVEIISTTTKDLKGGVKTIAQILDITEQKETEKKLKESEKKYRKIFEDSPFAIIIVNLDGELIDCNPATTIYSGYNREELIGKNFNKLSLIHPKYLPILEQIFSQFLKEEKSNTINIQMFKKNGKSIWINLQSSFLKLNGKNLIQIIIHNIDKEKQAEFIIKEELRRLEKLNKLQKDFIDRAAHELKTPLMCISGASELLLNYYDKNLNEIALEMLEIIQNNKQRMEILIQNLLVDIHLDYHRLKLNKQRIDICKVIKSIVNNLKPLFNNNNINLTLNSPPILMVSIDKIRFEQVLINLLSNAIKSTPENGKIEIIIESKDIVNEISISDTGVGLTDDEMSRLFSKFEKFERNDENLDYLDIQGLGLGLYISKEIITLHGGNLIIESEGRNKGAKVLIQLPNK